MKFIGVDLTSAFARNPRHIDVAVLSEDLVARFLSVPWASPDVVKARGSRFLIDALVAVEPDERLVYAIDGPQGLASIGARLRRSELALGTPGRTPYQLPPPVEGQPFQGYIRSSVDLFAGLTQLGVLAGLRGGHPKNADFFEVYPGAEWVVLAGRRLSGKTTPIGRLERRQLFEALGISLPENLPQGLSSADQNDALVGAYLAWCVHHKRDSVELVGLPPFIEGNEIREGQILHATGAACVNLPLPMVTDQPIGQHGEPGDWNSDGELLLVLTDTGAIHGTEPENAWLVPGWNYDLHTGPPHPLVNMSLTYAETFAGGRSWTMNPTVPDVLALVGIDQPQPLSRENRVTLRVSEPERLL